MFFISVLWLILEKLCYLFVTDVENVVETKYCLLIRNKIERKEEEKYVPIKSVLNLKDDEHVWKNCEEKYQMCFSEH